MQLLNLQGGSMKVVTATPAAIDLSQVTEILDVAHSILERHRDQDLADKTFTMQEYLEMSKMHPEWNYRELISKAHANLIDAVHLRMNAELAAITALFARLSSNHRGKETLRRPDSLPLSIVMKMKGWKASHAAQQSEVD
jgi:hypothetical protein